MLILLLFKLLLKSKYKLIKLSVIDYSLVSLTIRLVLTQDRLK